MADEVVLLDFWPSPFGIRVRIALAEKEVKYEYKEEDLREKIWNQKSPLLPTDPYQRALARFWADYIDKKVYDGGKKICMSKGEELEKAKKDFIDILKVLEGELGEKPYFGGQRMGFVDVALIPFYSRFYSYETFGKFSIEEVCPKLVSWGKKCMENESVCKSLPDPEKVFEFMSVLKKWIGVA
ncbi:hypothetical protein MKW98_029928 [Papaver atlanticum]|uniref:glutathione transferase n=1 Tax=Papaver atlanticum TaxID=357466 RepID=A0AAD4XZY8_9MAGN|nr:hypothetical protein MKW98_029928 [Papaver atlanticum]